MRLNGWLRANASSQSGIALIGEKAPLVKVSAVAERDASADGDALADIKRAARKENHRLVVKRGVVARDNRAAFERQPARVAAE